MGIGTIRGTRLAYRIHPRLLCAFYTTLEQHGRKYLHLCTGYTLCSNKKEFGSIGSINLCILVYVFYNTLNKYRMEGLDWYMIKLRGTWLNRGDLTCVRVTSYACIRIYTTIKQYRGGGSRLAYMLHPILKLKGDWFHPSSMPLDPTIRQGGFGVSNIWLLSSSSTPYTNTIQEKIC